MAILRMLNEAWWGSLKLMASLTVIIAVFCYLWKLRGETLAALVEIIPILAFWVFVISVAGVMLFSILDRLLGKPSKRISDRIGNLCGKYKVIEKSQRIDDIKPEVIALLAKTISLARKYPNLNISLLRRHLGTSYEQTAQLLELLESEDEESQGK